MACDQTTLELLSCYVDGEASSEESARAKAHLDTCPVCREMVKEWRHGLEMLDWTYSRALPDDIADPIFDAPSTVDEHRSTVWSWGRPQWSLAAGLAALLMIGILVHHLLVPPVLGGRLVASDEARTVRVAQGIRLKVEPNSQVTRIDDAWVKLDEGWVTANVKHRDGDFRIQARRIDVYDKGTRFRVGTDQQSDWVVVQEGWVEVRKGATTRNVGAGQMLVAKGDSQPVISQTRKEGESLDYVFVSAIIVAAVVLALTVWALGFIVRMIVNAVRRDSISNLAKVGFVLLLMTTGPIGAYIYYLIYRPIPGSMVGRVGDSKAIVWPNVTGALLSLLSAASAVAFIWSVDHTPMGRFNLPTPLAMMALYASIALFVAGLVGRAFMLPIGRLRDLSAYTGGVEESDRPRRPRWRSLLISTTAIIVMMLVIRAVALNVIYRTTLSKPGTIEVVRRPPPSALAKDVKSIPAYDPSKRGDGWQVDLRGSDLRSVNVEGREPDLLYADFDSNTKWPDGVSNLKQFKPSLFMQFGKNPGLGLRALHAQGITGKGIGIAIIDQTLLVDHVEYKDRLKMYEEIHGFRVGNSAAQMHGPAVASIAVGKNIGVAPGADLYYIAEDHMGIDLLYFLKKSSVITMDFHSLARSIDRVLEINQTLTPDKKIRVISISVGWSPHNIGYREVMQSVERAKKDGVFVVSSSLSETYKTEGMAFDGLGRKPLLDPDTPASYGPGLFWQDGFYEGHSRNVAKADSLLVPMDSRCIASPTGVSDYAFYRGGGWSWSIPYIAGLYALACQVKPDVTPQEFWAAALATGDTVTVRKDGRQYRLEKIVNPTRLIAALRKMGG